MWSLDWFAARDIARMGTPIRRAGWPPGRWVQLIKAVWRFHGTQVFRVVEAGDFGEEDFRARDWTTRPSIADICGSLPAFNSAPPVRRSWGDVPEMRPVPVPTFPDAV